MPLVDGEVQGLFEVEGGLEVERGDDCERGGGVDVFGADLKGCGCGVVVREGVQV